MKELDRVFLGHRTVFWELLRQNHKERNDFGAIGHRLT
jgi:hypothetical protein